MGWKGADSTFPVQVTEDDIQRFSGAATSGRRPINPTGDATL